MREISIHDADLQRIVDENDLKFIRLAICDLAGEMKNISILPGMLKTAFFRGMPFDCHRIVGFEHGEGLLLFPESASVSILPWRPSSGRVARILCDVCNPDGSDFEGDSRQLLKKAIRSARSAGFTFTLATENEFYLFRNDDSGNPTDRPLDNAGYMDIAPADRGENVRREICLTLEQMGILPERSYHEEGPGQNEIVFKAGEPLSAADNFLTYKMVVRTVAAGNGLAASFDPKPIPDQAGSGLRIILTPLSKGINSASDDELAGFAAGIRRRLPEICLFFNSTEASYRRLSGLSDSDSVRLSGSDVVLSSADLLINPYLAFALLITAGIEGLSSQEASLPSDGADGADGENPALPTDLSEAIELCRSSEFVKSVLPEAMVDRYIRLCRERSGK